MLLHHSQVGCVIGKGGGKIKELREVMMFFLLTGANRNKVNLR